jgi:erythromycin esterase-like protein
LADSYEALFHQVDLPRFLLSLEDSRQENWLKELSKPRLERAIGVIYRPETERASHYFFAQLPDQFDAVIHIDDSRAVVPLDQEQPEPEDAPETYPYSV